MRIPEIAEIDAIGYPPMGHGFPRRAIDITPQEVFYSPDDILGTRAVMIPGPTILRQPRLETTGYRMIEWGD